MHKSSDLFENRRPALGQPGALGSLYDIRSDNVLPGSILKSVHAPAECVRFLQTPKLTYNYTMKDTVEEKLQNLDISAELSASILGGFLDCSLSANYIMKKKSDSLSQSASVTCNMQTCTEILQPESLRAQLLSLVSLENLNATHVICGVEWGAQMVIEARTTTTIRTENHHIGEKPPQPQFTKHGASGTEATGKRGKDGEPEHTHTDKKESEVGTAKPETGTDEGRDAAQDTNSASGDCHQKNDMLSLKVRNEGALGQVLRQISRVDVGANLRSQDNNHLHTTEVEFKIITDIADLSNGSLPTDHAGVMSFLHSVPSNLEKVNNGKGVPLAFQLVPISEIARLFNIERSADVVLNQLDHGLMRDVVRTLDELMVTTQECVEYQAFVKAHLFCIPKSHHRAVTKNLRAAEGAQESFHKSVRQVLRSIRFENGDVEQLQEILEEYKETEPDEEKHHTMLQQYREKASFANQTKEKGARYLGFGEATLQNIIVSGKYEDVYVLHLSEKMRQTQTPTWMANWRKLFELLDNTAPQECVIVVDYDVDTTQKQTELEKPFIELWRDGNCIIPDVIEDLKALAEKFLIRCDDATKADRTRTKEPPFSKRLVRLRCPGIHCFEERRKQKWICPQCRTFVYYGYDDDDLYCKCSRYPFSSATFKCSNNVHGRKWAKPDTAYLRDQLKALEVSRECNILLLGPTGIGKSTFINAFSNYLKFDSLDDAINDPGKPHYAVASYFDFEEELKADAHWKGMNTISDPSQYRCALGEEGDSERFSKKGESATRTSTIYRFEVDDMVIRLIDTPGIGDTKGLEQDKMNIRNILARLESVDKLSGILFLLKPNDSRNTEPFSYYISELIRHLHIDASRNILFGFTNSAPGWYLGLTKAPLDAVLSKLNLKGIRGDKTSFFFDSGAFNFIVKAKQCQTSHFSDRQQSEIMWEKSTEEVYRLIDTVQDLPVHEVRKTLCLNRTRDFLEALPRPLTTFATNMKKSQDDVENLQKELAKYDAQDTELAQKLSKLKIPITDTERIDLAHPRVVCGHRDCDSWTACHDNCNVVAAEGIKGIEKISSCRAFRWMLLTHWAKCHRCGHDPSDHMKITYTMKEKTRPLNDDEIEKCQSKRSQTGNDMDILRRKQELAANVLDRLRKEEDLISAAQVLVGTYLGTFGITATEDMLIKYLDAQINQAQWDGASDKADELKRQRSRYTTKMEDLQKSMKEGHSVSLTEEAVDEAMEGLKKMDIFGESLTESLRVQKIALVKRDEIAMPCGRGASSKGLLRKFWNQL
jgi:GTP-binding protein EngB required for normal cell division